MHMTPSSLSLSWPHRGHRPEEKLFLQKMQAASPDGIEAAGHQNGGAPVHACMGSFTWACRRLRGASEGQCSASEQVKPNDWGAAKLDS